MGLETCEGCSIWARNPYTSAPRGRLGIGPLWDWKRVRVQHLGPSDDDDDDVDDDDDHDDGDGDDGGGDDARRGRGRQEGGREGGRRGEEEQGGGRRKESAGRSAIQNEDPTHWRVGNNLMKTKKILKTKENYEKQRKVPKTIENVMKTKRRS